MSWLDALILGIVQGLAEYLPISSSGHLEIFNHLLGSNLAGADSLQFDVVLHVATVLSTIVILWKKFVPLCTSFFTLKRDENTTYVWKLLLSCIPVGIVGVCFKDQVEALFGVSDDGSSNLLLVGICLCITAMLLSFAYFFRTRPLIAHHKEGRNISWLDAFIIGIAQAVAVLPGLSRSGSTIATGILLGDKREQVAQFSFFMVVIPILGEALLDLVKLLHSAPATAETSAVGLPATAIGFISAFVVGCLACNWMLSIVRKGKLVWFALYCIVVGIACIIFS